jgi:hypothetical protein
MYYIYDRAMDQSGERGHLPRTSGDLNDSTALKNTRTSQTGIPNIASYPQTIALVSATRWGLVVLLLAWIALWWGSSSLRRTLLILALTLRLSLRRVATVILLRGLAAVALLRRITLLRGVLALTGRRLLVLTLALGSSIAALTTVLSTGRRAIAAGSRMVGLLILRVVAAINGTEKKLDDPEIGGEVYRRVCARHLFLLVLEV